MEYKKRILATGGFEKKSNIMIFILKMMNEKDYNRNFY